MAVILDGTADVVFCRLTSPPCFWTVFWRITAVAHTGFWALFTVSVMSIETTSTASPAATQKRETPAIQLVMHKKRVTLESQFFSPPPFLSLTASILPDYLPGPKPDTPFAPSAGVPSHPTIAAGGRLSRREPHSGATESRRCERTPARF